jgi:hypothetical protein
MRADFSRIKLLRPQKASLPEKVSPAPYYGNIEMKLSRLERSISFQPIVN